MSGQQQGWNQPPNYYGQPSAVPRPPGAPPVGQPQQGYPGQAPPAAAPPGPRPAGFGMQPPGAQIPGARPPQGMPAPAGPGMRPPMAGMPTPQQQQQQQPGVPAGFRPPQSAAIRPSGPGVPSYGGPAPAGMPPQQQQQPRPQQQQQQQGIPPAMNGPTPAGQLARPTQQQQPTAGPRPSFAPPGGMTAPPPASFGAPQRPAGPPPSAFGAPTGPAPSVPGTPAQSRPGQFGGPPSALGGAPRPMMPPPSTPQQGIGIRPPGGAVPGSTMPPTPGVGMMGLQTPQLLQQHQQQQQPGGFGMRPPSLPGQPPAMQPPSTGYPGMQQQQQQQPPMMGGGLRPPGPPSVLGGGGGLMQPQQQQQQQQQMQQPPPLGGLPPPMGHQPAGALGRAPSMGPPGMVPGMGYDASAMQATLDAFQTLSLGAAPPAGPGQPAPQGPNPATFPRPAGTLEAQQEATGPPQHYSPANCPPEFLRLTVQGAPNSQALKARWHMPYGAIVHPLAETPTPVATANAGSATIVRCKRCRTYMNPFMQWLDGGRRFSCCICQMVNEVPVDYFCALDGTGKRIDHDQRPELCTGSVEYIAPAEYMVRAPMPPTYVFVIDVSVTAAANGMLFTICNAIRNSLDRLPGDDRTRVAFITFDNTLHFYNLRSTLSGPQMMVVAEVDDPFIPIPDDLLVTLSESRHVIDRLLESIPQSFGRNGSPDSAMGPALQAAFLIMNHIGGKLMLFQAATPSLGIGKVKARDNPALYGTDREYTLRAPDDPFYKRFSAEASRFQICIDVFALGTTYMDLPSLGALAKYTGGQVYYYPGFIADKDGPKLGGEIERNLTRETVWEAVMRIRCSKGLRISAFYGHFFVRSTDLLALPACDADKSFSVEITHEETLLTGQTAYVQAALLYTSSAGERRIRVHTAAVPVISDLLEMYKAADTGATIGLLSKWAVERSLSTKLDDVRASVQQRLASALREYRSLHMRGSSMGGPPPTSLVLPERMRSLPLLTLGLLKTAALRGTGRDVNSDERAAVGHQVTAAPVGDILRLTYPACYPVHDASGDWGRHSTQDNVVLPPTAPAGLEYFDPSGAYLIDNGRVMVLWLGTATPQQFYSAVFGAGGPTADVSGLQAEPVREGSDLSLRINNVIKQLRKHRDLHQGVYVVRQGTPMEAHVMPYFVEDRLTASGSPGYLDFVLAIQKAVMAKQ